MTKFRMLQEGLGQEMLNCCYTSTLLCGCISQASPEKQTRVCLCVCWGGWGEESVQYELINEGEKKHQGQ